MALYVTYIGISLLMQGPTGHIVLLHFVDQTREVAKWSYYVEKAHQQNISHRQDGAR